MVVRKLPCEWLLGLEGFLASITFQLGVFFIIYPSALAEFKVTADIVWNGGWLYIVTPLFVKTIFSASGVIMSLLDLLYSWLFRLLGACLGAYVWTFLVVRSFELGLPTPLSIIAFNFALLNILIWKEAWDCRPRSFTKQESKD